MRIILFILVIAQSSLVLTKAGASSFLSPFKKVPEKMTVSRLHTDPDIYLIENFITDEEGEEIKKDAASNLERSGEKWAINIWVHDQVPH